MEHVVFYPAADGAEAFCRAADLAEAVRLVERLSNDNGIGDVSVFALHAVPLAFRTYVHVELPGAEPDEPPTADDAVAVVEGDEVVMDPSIPPPPMPPSAEPERAEVEQLEGEQVEAEQAEWTDQDAWGEQAEWAEPADESFDQDAHELFDVQSEAPAAEQQDEDDAPPAVTDALAELQELQEPSAYSEPEPFELPFPTAPVDDAEHVVELPAPPVATESYPVPTHFESSPAELPPLTLAPGPLLFDGDDAPIASSGHYDLVEEAPGELADLIPADFTDLIPKDIPHGDLVRAADAEAVPVESFEAPEAAAEEPTTTEYALDESAESVESVESAEPVEAPVADFDGEPAPSSDDLPPMDVTEVPSDVSSIEMLDAAPIPAARETEDEPAHTAGHREGPRGLGFFGG